MNNVNVNFGDRLVKSVWGVLGRNKHDALKGNGNEGKRKWSETKGKGSG